MMAIILRRVRNRRNRRSRQLSPRQESDDIRWPASSFRCAPTHCHFSRSSTADAFIRSSFLAVSDLLSRPSSRRPLHFQSSPLLMSGPRAQLIKIWYKCNKSLASFLPLFDGNIEQWSGWIFCFYFKSFLDSDFKTDFKKYFNGLLALPFWYNE